MRARYAPLSICLQQLIICLICNVYRAYPNPLCWGNFTNYIFSISLANDFLLTIAIWPLVGYNCSSPDFTKKKYLEPVFLLSDRRNHNLKTVLLSDSYYQFSYTKQAIFFYTKIWVGCLNTVKSSTIFPVLNGLLTAQVFRKKADNIISSNSFIKCTMILTLFKKTWSRSCILYCNENKLQKFTLHMGKVFVHV